MSSERALQEKVDELAEARAARKAIAQNYVRLIGEKAVLQETVDELEELLASRQVRRHVWNQLKAWCYHTGHSVLAWVLRLI